MQLYLLSSEDFSVNNASVAKHVMVIEQEPCIRRYLRVLASASHCCCKSTNPTARSDHHGPFVLQVMSPFTPFFTEQMYQNLRRCQPDGEAPESVHYCDFPPAQQPWKGDDQIQRSVARMQTVIELSRTIRYNPPLQEHTLHQDPMPCRKERNQKTTPFGVNSVRGLVMYWAVELSRIIRCTVVPTNTIICRQIVL